MTPLHQAAKPTAYAAGGFFVQSLWLSEKVRRDPQEIAAELQATEERYSELFENANDAIFTVDVLGNFTSANRACEQLTGYRRTETSFMNFAEIVAPEYLGVVTRALERKLGGEGATTYELEIVAKDGHRVPLELSSRPIHRQGKVVGVQGIARDITDRRRALEALRRWSETREEEARRIAHALHDEASQLLSAVHLAVAELARELPPSARGRVEEISKLLNQVEDQLRRLAHELRPTILDDLGLLPALRLLAEGITQRAGLAIEVTGSTDGRLPAAIETAIYRSVQEALANVTKHAHATRAKVDLARDTQTIRCSISDDGTGFDVKAVLRRRGEQGLGLIGIRERLDPFRGLLNINSTAGGGTELVLIVPLDSAAGLPVSSGADGRESL